MSTPERLLREWQRAAALVQAHQISLFLLDEPPDPAPWQRDLEARLKEPLPGAIEAARELLAGFIDAYNDPFAGYIDSQSHTRYRERRQGDYVGIGLKYRVLPDQYPIVIGPLLGGPLETAGIEPGDRLIEADGRALDGLDSATVRDLLVGAEGSTLSLEVSRDGRRLPPVTVQRRTVVLDYVRSERLPGSLGYIRISRFGAKSHATLTEQLERLLDTSGLKGLILDLRDNPGGSTRAARAIVSRFSRADTVYCEQLRHGEIRMLARHGAWVTDLPLVVLVNEYSMSSAEIVAGALQGTGRARVVGVPTYGKGLIQKVYPLDPPLEGALRATIATYALADGSALHGRGVVPDIYVASAPDRLFRETGSLNIPPAGRAVQRQLLEAELEQRHSPAHARALIALPDLQLDVAQRLLGN